MNELTPAAAIAEGLGKDMLRLLVRSGNTPIERIIHHGLLADDGKLAKSLRQDIAEARGDNHVASVIGTYVQYILRKAVDEAHDSFRFLS